MLFYFIILFLIGFPPFLCIHDITSETLYTSEKAIDIACTLQISSKQTCYFFLETFLFVHHFLFLIFFFFWLPFLRYKRVVGCQLVVIISSSPVDISTLASLRARQACPGIPGTGRTHIAGVQQFCLCHVQWQTIWIWGALPTINTLFWGTFVEREKDAWAWENKRKALTHTLTHTHTHAKRKIAHYETA